MEWNVWIYNINARKIEQFNIFNHGGFREYMEKHLKECQTKKEFADKLKSELRYYFWSKSEWELIVEIAEDGRIWLIPWCGCRNPEEVKIDVTSNESFDWKGFAEKHISRQIYKNEAKIDVSDQVDYIWDAFVDYVWSFKKAGK